VIVIKKRMIVRSILLSKIMLRSQQISMAVDYSLDSDRKENRYTHSIEVANCCEIMNDCISEKVGFKTDYMNTAYIVGLLHDLGHTSFSHDGEVNLNQKIKLASDGKISFDGNSNNYVVIQKNDLLQDVDKEDRDYILASLAKHPTQLYAEQDYIREIIRQQTKRELKHLKKVSGGRITSLKKTIQCQIMDIADENCYLISDIIDSLNIMSKESLATALRKEVAGEIAEKIINELFKSKNSFIDIMNELFFSFCDNFTLSSEGEVVVIDKQIENIRLGLRRINKKYVIDSSVIKEVRAKNKVILDTVFGFFISDNKDLSLIPSNHYRREMKTASSKNEKLIIIRDMLGELTDKGVKKLYKKIIKA
jgi:dGTP triphosphohydrolase